MKKLKFGQVKTAAVISYFALGFNIVLSFLYTPWMVDKIGQANYGLYTLAISVISIFMLDFGLGTAVSRFIAKYRAENNKQAINDVVSAVCKLYLIIDIIIVVVLSIIFFFLDVIYVKLSPEEMEKFRILYLMVAFFNVISFPFSPLDGILNAYEKLIQLKLCSLFNKTFTVVLVVITLFFTTDVTAVVAANIIIGLITIVLRYLIVRKSTELKIDLRFKDKNTYKTLFNFTVWTMLISIMQRFTHSFAPSVLAITSGSLEIAVYSPAVVIEGYYYTFSTAIKGLFLPRISRFIAEKKENEILNLAIKLGRYQIVTLGLIFVGFICIGKEFMVLWMGPEYEKTYICTLILILPTLISATQQIPSTTVIAKNLVRYQAICMTVTGTLGLGISYVLSLYIGSIGVCLGTAISAMINIAYMSTVYKKHAEINMYEFYKKVYLMAIPTYTVSVVVSYLLIKLVHISGWYGLVLKGSVVSVVYLLITFLFYCNKAEKGKLFGFAKSRIIKGS